MLKLDTSYFDTLHLATPINRQYKNFERYYINKILFSNDGEGNPLQTDILHPKGIALILADVDIRRLNKGDYIIAKTLCLALKIWNNHFKINLIDIKSSHSRHISSYLSLEIVQVSNYVSTAGFMRMLQMLSVKLLLMIFQKILVEVPFEGSKNFRSITGKPMREALTLAPHDTSVLIN